MNVERISWFFAYAAIFLTLIPFGTGIYTFSSRPLYLKLLCFVMGVSFLADVLTGFIRLNSFSNYFKCIEFLFLLTIFYLAINKKKWRTPFLCLAFICSIFFILDLLFSDVNKINSYSAILSCLTFIVLPVIYFYTLLKELPTQKVQQLPMFWISIGVLIYSSGNLFLFTIYDYLAKNESQDGVNRLFIFWDFHNSFSIASYMIFTVAFLKDKREIPLSSRANGISA